jgi:hypothetical protein
MAEDIQVPWHESIVQQINKMVVDFNTHHPDSATHDDFSIRRGTTAVVLADLIKSTKTPTDLLLIQNTWIEMKQLVDLDGEDFGVTDHLEALIAANIEEQRMRNRG